MAPTFNLLRHLHTRCNNKINKFLTTFDVLLGAPIVLPKIMMTADGDVDCDIDLFEDLGDERARHVLDMHFYVVDYWRECVNTFVTHTDSTMRIKVLTRLNNVIALEHQIREIMCTVPDDYVPPTCQFIADAPADKKSNRLANKKPTITKKQRAQKARASQLDHEEDLNQTSIEPTATANKYTSSVWNGAMSNEYFRPLDPITMLLFEENLTVQYPLPRERIGHAMGLLEFK